ncbi:MAG TPA: hypothetical protein VM425_07250 [Myxococcota bacterium]|nr:hypothetical protein [Myxococcota bacterium]
MREPRVFFSKLLVTVAVAVLMPIASGCSGGNTTVKCSRDTDCPDGQQCVGGNCQLPGDPGIITCQTSTECPIGYECKDGICQHYSDEPDGGQDGQDGGDIETQDGGDQPGDNPADQPADEDTRDFSNLNFTLAVSRGGSSGPATQCLLNVHPQANKGPLLPAQTLAGGYTLSGKVQKSGSPVAGAEVSLAAEHPECVPAPVATDAQGSYTFYLPGGSYHSMAVVPDGLVGHDRLTLGSNTTRNIMLPATTDLGGGPLFESGPVDLNNWTVMAYYLSGVNGGELANNGVKTGPPNVNGMFTIPLAAGATYDLLGYPPAGVAYPLQVLYPDVDPAGADLTGHLVRAGVTLSGSVTTAGAVGAPGCEIGLLNTVDPRLHAGMTSGTNGLYQILVRTAKTWKVTIVPSGAAFAQGAMTYIYPELFISTDQSKDIELGQGEHIVFTGILMDTSGSPVTDAQVRLLINQAPLAEGSYSLCDPAPVTTAADGTFEIACNLAP